MNKQTEFLLRYAKIGVLYSMEKLDAIEKEELKNEYIKIKSSITQEEMPLINKSKDSNKNSKVKKWFQGIGDRQRKYQESHKGELI